MTEVTTIRIDASNIEDLSQNVLSQTGVIGFALDSREGAAVTLKSCVFPDSHISLHAYQSTGHEFAVEDHPYFKIDSVLEGRLERVVQDRLAVAQKEQVLVGQPGNLHAKLMIDTETGTNRGISCFVAPEALEFILASNGLKVSPAKGQIVLEEVEAAARATKRLLDYAYEEFFERGVEHVSLGRARLFETLLSDHIAELFELCGYAERSDKTLSDGVRLVLAFEEVAKQRFAEQVTVTDLATTIHTSARALQRAFKKHRGISPSLYLSTLRIEAARARLLSARSGETVTTIALSCGINHLGRFAARYRSLYGESPQETMRAQKNAIR